MFVSMSIEVLLTSFHLFISFKSFFYLYLKISGMALKPFCIFRSSNIHLTSQALMTWYHVMQLQ